MPRKTTSENDLILSASGTAPRRAATTRSKRATKTAELPASMDSSTNALTSVEPEPTRDEIAALAFSYWEARGCQGGSPEEDWLRAEQHLRSLRAHSSVATA